MDIVIRNCSSPQPALEKRNTTPHVTYLSLSYWSGVSSIVHMEEPFDSLATGRGGGGVYRRNEMVGLEDLFGTLTSGYTTKFTLYSRWSP